MRAFIQHLASKAIENPRLEVDEFIAHILSIPRCELYLHRNRPLTQKQLALLKEMVDRRGKREPMAYIIGKVLFADVLLKVSEAVLIPRPETEILVEKIAQELKGLDLKEKVLWDVCSGSGCIGIALKKRFSDLTVFLSDLSYEALLVAEENARLNEVSVHLKQGDLFAPFVGQKCDFFVCNPPYVSEEEMEHLSPEVRGFEPRVAFMGGETGLDFYRRIAQELALFLKPKAKGWLELGSGQGPKVTSLFDQEKYRCSYENDWAGHDRWFSLEKE